jgi:pimeloyl-ACP methyl ester carboxylesterase
MSLVALSRGRFWVAADREAPMYAEWERPERSTGKPPIVLIHGGGGQGTDWLNTPDGRPGWAPCLSERGYSVYVVDRPGHGRGAAHAGALGEMGPPPSASTLAALFRPAPGAHPTAHLHTQWPTPDSPIEDDETLLALLAASRPMPKDLTVAHELERHAGAELLERIGPAVLITHSAGAAAGWLMADARPELVLAIVALEPIGPPFRPASVNGAGLPWGLTAAPPRSATTADPDRAPASGTVADSLPGLAGIPIVLVSAEASAQRHFDTASYGFLARGGNPVELLRLADVGVRGNGHGMIFERNHLEVLAPVLDAIERLTQRRRS